MSRNIGQPRPGLFKMRMIKDGPFVPAAIVYRQPRDPETSESLDRSYMWEAWINGELTREPSHDPMEAGVFKIWTVGREIDQDEFRALSLTPSEAPAGVAVNLSTLSPLEP